MEGLLYNTVPLLLSPQKGIPSSKLKPRLKASSEKPLGLQMGSWENHGWLKAWGSYVFCRNWRVLFLTRLLGSGWVHA